MITVERRTNSIRIGWGSWRLVWTIDTEREIYCPIDWRADWVTPRIVWMTKLPSPTRCRLTSDDSREPHV